MVDMNRNCRGGCNNRRPMQTNEMRMQATNCSALKKKLQTIDFAIIDTVLYLNMYPSCTRALEHYHKLIKEREILANIIKEKCGPITPMCNESRTEWNWVAGPWPWEPDAN